MRWYIWAPVIAGYASLYEVRQKWTIDDVADYAEAMEVKAEAEAYANRQASQKP